MIWICPRCNEELGELNGWCEYCKHKDGTIVYNPDKYYIREIRIRHIGEYIMEEVNKVLTGEELLAHIEADKRMTPQEKLHAKLFYHETVLVKDMDTLTLRAHREELAQIAFEARARLTAVDAEENNRKKLARGDRPTGFEKSINTDETTTNAINKIKERKAKMSSTEKIQAGLQALFEKSGMSKEDAEKLANSQMSAGTILSKLKDKVSKDIIKEEQTRSPLSQSDGFVINKKPSELSKTDEAPKAFFNPFEKKS